MKLYVTSDIHLEFGDCIINNQHHADVLILSGDIMIAQDMHDHPESASTIKKSMQSDGQRLGGRQESAQRFRDFLKRCSVQFPHVIYVAGNHEFYHGKWPIGLQYLRDECDRFSNVYFMENDSRTINDFTFIGCTLWTDMNKNDPVTMFGVTSMMNDFNIIRNSDRAYSKLQPKHVVKQHNVSLQFIKSIVEQDSHKNYVVVGHHAPSRRSIKPKYATNHVMNGAYSSDLEDFITDHPQIRLWTHGHTHDDFDYMVGSTRVVCNPRGYLGYEPRAEIWQPKLVELAQWTM